MKSDAPNPKRHPCFHAEASRCFGRIHLPVAPKCNVQCLYCNRRYDCPNESRPGVTSAVLSPTQALEYLERVHEKVPALAVVGVAGPGDPFANADETLETMRRVRQRYPDILLCVATNGLAVGPHVPALAELGCTHVSVTVNAVDPEVGQKLYAWVRHRRKIYRGRQAAEVLLESQLAAIRALKAHNITVKVNCILVPGVNEEHVKDVARRMGALGVDLFNCMPLVPNEGTAFAEVKEPPEEQVRQIRDEAAAYLPQMSHCTRCRADAVGLLGRDLSGVFQSDLVRASCGSGKTQRPSAPHVAVATREGMLVNLHLGEAERLQIWARTDEGYAVVEERCTPAPGMGVERWRLLASMLQDCRAVLVNAAGENPRRILEEEGLSVVVMEGPILDGLEAVWHGRPLPPLGKRNATTTCSDPTGRRSCRGDGLGCG